MDQLGMVQFVRLCDYLAVLSRRLLNIADYWLPCTDFCIRMQHEQRFVNTYSILMKLQIIFVYTVWETIGNFSALEIIKLVHPV